MQALLALGNPPPGTAPNPTAQTLNMVGMLVLMGVLMYFIGIRPQRVRAKQLEALLKSLKPGDRISTASGIVGTVVAVKEKTVSIRSADSKLEILKSAVAEITERAGESSDSKS
jgi:preprotein translocase subunit YajC